MFASITPVLGSTREEAEAKYQEALQYASEEGVLAYWCGISGIDLSRFGPDEVITEQTPGEGAAVADVRIQSLVANLSYKGDGVPEWTPRNIAKAVALGASGPVPVGTAEDVVDEMERWVRVADMDGFNVGHITTPGTWEDVVELLVPELRRRGWYAPRDESGTMRERIYGSGQSALRDDHPGSRHKHDVYRE